MEGSNVTQRSEIGASSRYDHQRKLRQFLSLHESRHVHRSLQEGLIGEVTLTEAGTEARTEAGREAGTEAGTEVRTEAGGKT